MDLESSGVEAGPERPSTGGRRISKAETQVVNRKFGREDAVGLRASVKDIVESTPLTDIHTHLYAPAFEKMLLWGIDEMLTYHYLVAEYFRLSPTPYEAFWKLDKKSQADTIWETLFLRNSPLSEACRGVITSLDRLGLDVSKRDLKMYRDWFAAQDVHEHVSRVFRAARMDMAVMTNDPFDDDERETWKLGYEGDPRFRAALRIDPILNDWKQTAGKLKLKGYECAAKLDPTGRAEVRRFLSSYIKRMKPLYMAVSLPPEFKFPEESARAEILEECVLPVAEEYNIPFAMMIGVRRAVNPALKLAGDGVGTADVRQVESICERFPRNKFMVTMLARENQHALCVAARKFRNLLVFGCWWFMNNPSLIEELTRMRMELLGPSFIPQHSDARVLEQVIYKWTHSREIITRVLRHKYADLIETGWEVSEEEIRRDVQKLLGGAFWDFLDAKV